jgi:tRNA A-37 threonylcarbamoyl transferase component Bud32
MKNNRIENPFGHMNGVKWFELLHRGKWANANVYRFELAGDSTYVRKGFCFRGFLIRWTIGQILTRREAAVLKYLAGIPGIPEKAKRCCAFCLRYRYLEGETLGTIWKRRQKLPKRFFLEAEELLARVHKRKVVHLDLRRGDNWIVQTNGSPGIIDFQSGFSVAWLPSAVQEKLYSIDVSGIYKFWDRICEEPLDEERRSRLERINRVRKFWIFKGYAFRKAKSKKKVSKRTN